MTVKELKEYLSDFRDELDIILADVQGNFDLSPKSIVKRNIIIDRESGNPIKVSGQYQIVYDNTKLKDNETQATRIVIEAR